MSNNIGVLRTLYDYVGSYDKKYWHGEAKMKSGHIYRDITLAERTGINTLYNQTSHEIFFRDESGKDLFIGGTRFLEKENGLGDVMAFIVNPLWSTHSTDIVKSQTWSNTVPDDISKAQEWVLDHYEAHLEKLFDENMKAAKKILSGDYE